MDNHPWILVQPSVAGGEAAAAKPLVGCLGGGGSPPQHEYVRCFARLASLEYVRTDRRTDNRTDGFLDFRISGFGDFGICVLRALLGLEPNDYTRTNYE